MRGKRRRNAANRALLLRTLPLRARRPRHREARRTHQPCRGFHALREGLSPHERSRAPDDGRWRMASLVDRNVFRSPCRARNERNRYFTERSGIGRTSAPQARSSRTTASTRSSRWASHSGVSSSPGSEVPGSIPHSTTRCGDEPAAPRRAISSCRRRAGCSVPSDDAMRALLIPHPAGERSPIPSQVSAPLLYSSRSAVIRERVQIRYSWCRSEWCGSPDRHKLLCSCMIPRIFTTPALTWTYDRHLRA
jgi:hypothetical protein